MRLVIDYSNTKREINGSFFLSGNRRDLESLISQIGDWLRENPGSSAGWMTIAADLPSVKVNTRPKQWDEAGD